MYHIYKIKSTRQKFVKLFCNETESIEIIVETIMFLLEKLE